MNSDTHCYVCEHNIGDFTIMIDCECICHVKFLSQYGDPCRIVMKCLIDYPAMSSKQPIYDDITNALKKTGIIVKQIELEQYTE